MENRQIKQAGLKVTAPRVKILNVLERSDKRHLSAENVYRELLNQGEEIGLATVYRVLTQFEGAGLVRRRHFESGQAVFELSDGEHHDHLICIKCSAIVEFTDPALKQYLAGIAAHHGFEIKDQSLVIYGVCPACQGSD
ncbi:ferric iron uptake transcriptional regulator [Caldichromatium japonicum]|uniref:Ferric uptake regulation protein n=1 Tax=Caldichromatium japonicum TaxID=2699430 RepID=A0A6G7VEV3_9GAMM|nr:ferric iron uptake transcriptional regulator [Caldichromatium japonicum]QIK38482.1 ferric iron uptake transcriptional regulator [Caldichromatium japonicum]